MQAYKLCTKLQVYNLIDYELIWKTGKAIKFMQNIRKHLFEIDICDRYFQQNRHLTVNRNLTCNIATKLYRQTVIFFKTSFF